MVDKAPVDSAEAWSLNLHLVYGMAQALSLVPLAEMVRQAEHAQAIVPLFDPSLWIKNGNAAKEDLEVLKAALAFVSRFKELLAKSATSADGTVRALAADDSRCRPPTPRKA